METGEFKSIDTDWLLKDIKGEGMEAVRSAMKEEVALKRHRNTVVERIPKTKPKKQSSLCVLPASEVNEWLRSL